jgi:transcription elongation factor Elf1
MFLHVSEDNVDHELRRGQTFCKACDTYTIIRLVERVRTVTAYWVLKSSERKHFLICDGCKAQFRVKARDRNDLDQTDIDSLLRVSGGRYVPFLSRVMVFVAVITVWMPVVGLMMAWMCWRDRASLPPSWIKLIRFLLWIALLVHASLIAAWLGQHFFGTAES